MVGDEQLEGAAVVLDVEQGVVAIPVLDEGGREDGDLAGDAVNDVELAHGHGRACRAGLQVQVGQRPPAEDDEPVRRRHGLEADQTLVEADEGRLVGGDGLHDEAVSPSVPEHVGNAAEEGRVEAARGGGAVLEEAAEASVEDGAAYGLGSGGAADDAHDVGPRRDLEQQIHREGGNGSR